MTGLKGKASPAMPFAGKAWLDRAFCNAPGVEVIDKPLPLFPGDYTGTTPPLGYAWCLGKAVPVYDTEFPVENPQFARFYYQKLPTFSSAEYPSVNTNLTHITNMTRVGYMNLMSRGAFEHKTDFPCMALFRQTDPKVEYVDTIWGVNRSGRVSADGSYRVSMLDKLPLYELPEPPTFFDAYIAPVSDLTLSNCISLFIRRENGEFGQGLGSYDPFYADEDGNMLRTSNVADYLVLTKVPYKT